MKKRHIKLLSFLLTVIPGILFIHSLPSEEANVLPTIPQLAPKTQTQSPMVTENEAIVYSSMVNSPLNDWNTTLQVVEDEPVEVNSIWKTHTIRKGENMGQILQKYNLPIQPILSAAQPILDLSQIRVGRTLRFNTQEDAPHPHEIHYPMGEDDTLILNFENEQWTATKNSTLYERKESTRHLVIQSSLWAAATRATLRPADIINLASVLEYDVDFNTELHPGDSATLLVEELWKDDEMVKIGEIKALRFQSKSEEYIAIRHIDSDGYSGYYTTEGIAREKIFLRSPIAFSQVTSSFNPGRFHPILKTKRPHNGTDFGAPSGTPVRAVADGNVVHAAWNGGHGKFVKLEHSSPYETSYSHLSVIKVKPGQHVKKGQVIGLVGTTGLSTGPIFIFNSGKTKNSSIQ
jgi:murein DD-endopeptidase MepM/ murein hydrolase activator NlpD